MSLPYICSIAQTPNKLDTQSQQHSFHVSCMYHSHKLTLNFIPLAFLSTPSRSSSFFLRLAA
jgi:hypothetical protein